MKKKIIITLIIIVLIIVAGFAIYRKWFYDPNPSEEEILAELREKLRVREGLKNVIEGTESPGEDYQISISEAREKAIIIFNSLGEENLSKDNVLVREMVRDGKKYYYISSKENSAEVEISTGKVTRINNIMQ